MASPNSATSSHRTGKSTRTARGRTKPSDDHPDLFESPLDVTLEKAVKQAFAEESPSSQLPPAAPSAPLTAPLSAPDLPPGDAAESVIADGLLPARMLNEYVYCPRLYYYEHVEGVFVHNADTRRGASIHKRVDAGTGALPDPQSELPETIHSRSVSLGSERLGVTAKLDLVEAVAGTPEAELGEESAAALCPVDYKAGAPKEGENGNELWPTDKMQLGLQILLLRDNGYTCDEGVIYYRKTRQRVHLAMTPALEEWILAQIQEARRINEGPIPPPLVDSPKCVRCSLNSICLPDETRLLQQPETLDAPPEKPPRRLIAPRDDTRPLYLNSPGLRVGRADERLEVREDGRRIDEIRMGDLSHVALFGRIQMSTEAIQALCSAEIPISYFSTGGWFYGMTRGHGAKNVFTRIEQFRRAADPIFSLGLARKFVHGKIRNHRTMLMRLHGDRPEEALLRLKRLAQSALDCTSIPELLGTEGSAAACYFGAFDGMIKVEDDIDLGPVGPTPTKPFSFEFAGRNRRPPTDPVNALLSLAYSLLSKDATLAACAVGFDPYVGFYHQPRFGRPALALDLMEEFRPLIAESAVLTCINNRMIQPEHFVRAGKAVNLTREGRKIFFTAYEQRMASLVTHPIFDYQVCYRRVLELQFRLLARHLTGEIPEYVPFTTR